MRIALASVLVASLASDAAADAKITQLVKFFDKEIATCRKNARGVAVVIERGQPVAGNDKELADDLAALAKAHATVQGHCDEITTILDLMRADSSATYKQLQPQIDEHDKKIRASRLASRQALADAEPLITRAVPRINKLIATADAAARPSAREQKEAVEKAQKAAAEKAAAEKAAADKATADKAAADKAAAEKAKPSPKQPNKFPSGRAVEMPPPGEAWTIAGTADTDIAEYAFAGAKASLIVRVRSGSPSCDQVKTSATLVGGRTAPQPVEVTATIKPLKPSWYLGWTEGDHSIRALCVATKQGVVVGRIDTTLAGDAPLELALSRMVGVFKR